MLPCISGAKSLKIVCYVSVAYSHTLQVDATSNVIDATVPTTDQSARDLEMDQQLQMQVVLVQHKVGGQEMAWHMDQAKEQHKEHPSNQVILLYHNNKVVLTLFQFLSKVVNHTILVFQTCHSPTNQVLHWPQQI